MRQMCKRRQRGFTIIELAVALFLFTLIFSSVAIPLQTRFEVKKIEDTEQLLDKVREALLGYASAHGYFPCPADDRSGGVEPAGTDHTSGACPAYFGFLPGSALGIPVTDAQGYALDAWGGRANRIRYAVSNHTVRAVTNPFTRANGMRSAGIASLADPALSLFHVCGSASGVVQGASCGAAVTIVSTTPVIVWSAGANASGGGASADEAQNPNPNGGSADRVFVSRLRVPNAAGEFDDQLAWIPMPILVSRLVAAGQIP
jgi:prepilin-type N-terminal cleavage/methylation domain-containing protein